LVFSVVLPAPPLRPYIARYWSLRGSFAREEAIVLPPDGGVHLLAVHGAPVCSRRFESTFGTDRIHLVGAMLRADQQVLSGEQHLVGVSFAAAGFARFHRHDAMHTVSNRVEQFDERLPVDSRKSLAELAPILDRHWLERLTPPSTNLAMVIADIEASGGRIRIDALLRRHAMTGRTLERHFAREVGITPKEFADLTRFRTALRALENRSDQTLTDLALDHGYYDHAHLTREFQRFMGEAPSRVTLSDLSKHAGL
jgi:AraC-like DNA-binding protein